jgi:hypothetical protein
VPDNQTFRSSYTNIGQINMKPLPPKEVVLGRPLFDPNPDTFVAKRAVADYELRRCHLSDFVVVAFQVLIAEGHLTKKQVDIFETDYVRGAKLRASRKHDGQDARAPDNTIITWGSVGFSGAEGGDPGPWSVETLKEAPGYADWLKKLKQTDEDVEAKGGIVNEPLPAPEEVRKANEYVAIPMKPKSTKQVTTSTNKDNGAAQERPAGNSRERGTLLDRLVAATKAIDEALVALATHEAADETGDGTILDGGEERDEDYGR